MGGHPSTSGYDSGYRAVGYPMMRILVSRMWLLLLCAMCASECAAKRHPVTGKLVGYRPTDFKLFFPKDENEHKHRYDEIHEHFDPMAEPIKHLDGKHYEDIFKLADTDEDGRVTIEELEHKDKWTASYPPGGHPGMSKETFLKRHKKDFTHASHGHDLWLEHDVDADGRMKPDEYRKVAPLLWRDDQYRRHDEM